MQKRVRLQENIQRGGRLKAARLDAGYESGADAAAELEVDYSLYNNHETGWRGIPRETARRYADFFKVNLDWLYENIGEIRGGAVKKQPGLLDGLPPAAQREALDYIEFLKTKYGI